MRVLLALTLIMVGGDGFAAGLRAWREGRVDAALAAFAAEEQRAGAGASAELLHDLSMAALAAGEVLVAEGAADRAAARGGKEFVALRDFVRGNAAFLRSDWVLAEAAKPETERDAVEQALAHALLARSAWQLAAASRPDWPAARRNVERAVLRIDELQQRKAGFEPKKDRSPAPPPEESPPPPEPPQPDETRILEEETTAAPELDELTPEQLQRLFGRLAEQEKAKRALRRDLRASRHGDVERDW